MKPLIVALAVITAAGLICNSKSAFVWPSEDPKVIPFPYSLSPTKKPFPYSLSPTNEPFLYGTTPGRKADEGKGTTASGKYQIGF